MSEKIPHWLMKQAVLSPDHTAVEMPDGNTFSFRQLHELTDQTAKKLSRLGIKRGTKAAVLSGNSMEMITVIHALSYIGAVAVLLNTRLAASELVYQLKDSKAEILIGQRDRFEGKRDRLEACCELVSFEELKTLSGICYERQIELDLNEVCSIIYTSGTTGNPKGVLHTYGNHWWSAVGSMLNLGLNKEDKWLSPLPMFHVGGLSALFKSAIYGMSLYVTEKFDTAVVHEAIMNKGVTIVSVVTVMLERLLAMQQGKGDYYPSQFRCMLLGGGPAPLHVLERSKARSIPVFQSYGMTETSSQIVTLSPNDALSKLGSAGKPLLPAQLKIVQEQKELPSCQPGEIMVKGPMVTLGYYQNEAANASAFQDGWLATGDIGYLDEEGFLFVLDRRKDLIISGGENIYPAEIEAVLTSHNQVKEAAVIAMDDDTWGSVPAAFIVPEKTAPSSEALAQYCSEQLAKYKVPKLFKTVDKLPRNASNKIVRHQLRQFLPEKGDVQ